mgnify:CR=1 FL=1
MIKLIIATLFIFSSTGSFSISLNKKNRFKRNAKLLNKKVKRSKLCTMRFNCIRNKPIANWNNSTKEWDIIWPSNMDGSALKVATSPTKVNFRLDSRKTKGAADPEGVYGGDDNKAYIACYWKSGRTEPKKFLLAAWNSGGRDTGNLIGKKCYQKRVGDYCCYDK